MKNIDSGLSGCKLTILDEHTIRKYSSTIEYNSRLVSQANKQIFFSNFILRNIDTAKIYQVNKDILYSFDMEYIPGLSFNEYFSVANYLDVDFVIKTLFHYFDFLISSSKRHKINNQITKKLNLLESTTIHKEYICFLKDKFLINDIFAPKSFCHGDLTFTNILFHKNRLFFIDFLDSYVDSFICDLVKLKQDLYYFWNLNIQKNESLRIKQIYRIIWNKIYNRYSDYIESECFQILDSLNSLRIEPYLTNPHQKDILNNIIKNCNLYEKFSHSYGRKII